MQLLSFLVNSNFRLCMLLYTAEITSTAKLDPTNSRDKALLSNGIYQ